jgi:hypothetical protein
VANVVLLGLVLIVATVLIHVAGLEAVAYISIHRRRRIEQQRAKLPRLLAPIIGVVGLTFALLHGIEVALWAALYRSLGAFAWPEALFYSLDSFTTRGESGLVLPTSWQMLGAIEAANGVLLFGLTTAFLFTVMQVWWPMYMRRFGSD